MIIGEMKNFLRILLNFILPHKCQICLSNLLGDEMFCIKCWKNTDFISDPKCYICGIPFAFDFHIPKNLMICGRCQQKKPFFDKVISIFKYSDNIKKIIHQYKYQDKTYLARHLARLLLRKIENEVNISHYHVITAVPLHRKKLRQRFYNQSSLLAGKIAKASKITFIHDLLSRVKHENTQIKLSYKERQKNIKNAFAINKKYQDYIKNKNLILIDDVITTSATANECCRILKKGAKYVLVATVARTTI